MRFSSLTLLFLSAGTGPAAAQAPMLDLIPDDSAVAIFLRHPDELRKKGDQFFKDLEVDPGIRPTQALDFVLDYLGLKQGVDFEKPGGAVLLRSKDGNNTGLGDLEANLYITVPFTDIDAMAANFDLKKGQLPADKIIKLKGRNEVNFALVSGKRIYLAIKRDPLERIVKAKSFGEKLKPDQQKSYNATDVLLYFGQQAFRDEWGRTLDNVSRDFDKLADQQEKEALSQLSKGLASLDFALVGVRVVDGLGVSVLTGFQKDTKESRELLASLGRENNAADLKSLPEGNVVVAQAYAGEGTKSALLARVLLHVFLKNVVELKQLTSAADRPAYIGVFNEIWQRLQGNRIGVYLTSDESKLGLFSLVAILDTADANKFLGEIRTLARIADGTLDLTKKGAEETGNLEQLIKDLGSDRYAVRASATTKLRLLGEPALAYLEKAASAKDATLEAARRAEKLIVEISRVAAERRKELLEKDLPRYIRPAFAWVSKAETRQGLPVDIVHIKLKDKDGPAAGAMKQYFGPDWDKLRLTVIDKQVIAILGSEVDLFEEAVRNVKAGKPGLAASKRFTDFARQKPASPSGEFHASVGALMSLVTGAPVGRDNALSSFSLTVGEASLQLDLLMPMAEFRVIAKKAFPF